MSVSAFDVRKQLAFYGAYHSNATNILIHVVFVPVIIWTSKVLIADIPVPSFVPAVHYTFSDYLAFDLNWSAIFAAIYLAYYYILEPTAAALYTPQWVLSTLTAAAFTRADNHVQIACVVNGLSWIAQFVGHGVAEGRAPALLDNLLGAVVLAPFFVHLEILFTLGFRPEMHKQLKNDVGVELARIKKIEGDKKRAAQRKVT
ncbi:DUF962-domain-containing protein [Auriscalpium vulgare]|uniref:DUF962-domain-containing protein n=1 Tax=Auriscalpium vulgare TaxID=40419 RepID=A0ACB8RTI9_9AGAM|nr:DUF962-domain-containing protein [Auriscalpium vulgare]